jgi:hypothetical protein
MIEGDSFVWAEEMVINGRSISLDRDLYESNHISTSELVVLLFLSNGLVVALIAVPDTD